MKVLDVVGTGAKAAKAAVAAVVSPEHQSQDVRDELARRAQINSRAEIERGRRAEMLDVMLTGRSSWLGPRRRHWLR